MFAKILSVFVAGLALASACDAPIGDPSGNPIAKPGLNEIVPVGKPYTITWNPTTPGTVTIKLLRGPSTNVVPLGAPLASGIQNTGTFEWTPSTDLEDDVTHYGLQIIVDDTCAYQYSTQFGISNPNKGSSASSSSSSSSSESAAPTSSSDNGVVYTTEVVTAITTYCPGPTSLVINNYTSIIESATTITITDCPCTWVHEAQPTTPPVYSTGAPAPNSSYVAPTGPMTVPTTLQPAGPTAATTSSTLAMATGAAPKVAAGFGGAALAFVAAVVAL